MMWATRFISLLALAASLPLSEAVKPTELDVWVPEITYPDGYAIWYTGQCYDVTWDNSNPPASITNRNGKIYLVSNNRILFNYQLASDFDIRDGQVEIQVPYVNTGTYQIVLFGDSGNFSPDFNIVAQ